MRPVVLALASICMLLAALGGTASTGAQAGYDLFLSFSPDRSGAVPLNGEIVDGDIYVFTSPDTDVSRVRFFIDGTLVQEEKHAPYDLAGTAPDDSAFPFDTTTLTDALHNIEAEVFTADGSVSSVIADFTVANSGPSLQFSASNISFAALTGTNPSDKTVDLDTSDGLSTSYSITDDAAWLTVTPDNGTTPDTLTLSVDVSGLAEGTYTSTVTAVDNGYNPASLTVELNITDDLEPDQVHLAWVDDPATTINVVWRTLSTSTESTVEYRPLGDATWQSAAGALRPSGAAGTLHEVQITGLTPATTYEYRVRGDESTWSQIYTTRTAPSGGPVDFDAIYVADTGLVGREDGLATGTQQVIDEITALDPNLLLLGGDYAYFNTDKRFGTLDNTIDAWFDQMADIAGRSPMMPTYGNHEVLLGEDFQAWADRFPTPEGFDGRRNYSFDIGDVHFVSILAISDSDDLPSATVDWIQQDILAAQAAGQQWIVPFMHVSPYGDGKNHPSNAALRAQLGPLFESLGVQIVFTSHDQALERSYPLSNMPDLNTPTSTSEVCYTQSDGVVWVKSSPGGKLSNKNGDFSQFASDPPPEWTAVRDNTMHHFSRLISSSAGSLTVETYGVVGDGTPPTLLDSFEYTNASCPPELSFDSPGVTLSADEGETVTAQVTLETNDGSAANFSISDDAPWLTVTPTNGNTPDALTLSADATGLVPGTHVATVTATAPGYATDTLDVMLEVALSGYDLFVSSSPDRSSPALLDGETVAGDIYVFTAPDAGVKRVTFLVDGSQYQVENKAPFDLAGTNSDDTARPFDTTDLSDGPHSVVANLESTDGSSTSVTANFNVANNAPALAFTPDSISLSADEGASDSSTADLIATDGGTADFSLSDDADWLTVSPTSGSTPQSLTVSADASDLTAGIYTAVVTASAPGYLDGSLNVTFIVGGSYDIMVSTSADRSNPVPLDGETVAGDIYVFTSPDINVEQVTFFVDGSQTKVEKKAPFDLAGTNNDDSAKPYDTTQLADGAHTVTANIKLSDGSSLNVSAGFNVANGAPALVFTPDSVSMTVDEGGSTSTDVNLGTTDGTSTAYTISDNAPWLTVSSSGSTPDTVTLNADASGLTPDVYTATVTATAGSYLDGTLNVTLVVGGSYSILLSGSPDRTNPVSLDGQTVSGDIFVFTGPDIDVEQVTFFVDGSQTKVEKRAPFDLAGTNNDDSAIPYDTTQLADGAHNVSAFLTLSNGSGVNISASMNVVNNSPSLQFSPGSVSLAVASGGNTSTNVTLDTTDGLAADYAITDDADWLSVSPASGATPDTLTVSIDASALADGFYSASVTATASTHDSDVLDVSLSVGAGYDIWVSELADRSDPVPLDGQTVSGDIYAFTSPDTNVSSVDFWVDDVTMSGAPTQSEANAPFDLGGTNTNGTARPYATAQLADGPHTVTAALHLSGGETVVISANFLTSNGCSPLPCSEVLVNLPYELDYDHMHDHGGVLDGNGVGTGFTYVDQPTNGTNSTGYLPDNLFVDLTNGVFEITSTAGLADGAANSQDNRIGVGIDAPSQITIITTTLVSPPAGTGNGEQAGLWWANDEDDFIRLGVVSTPSGTVIDYMMEVNGLETDRVASPVIDLTGASVQFKLRADPTDRSMVASYSINGGAFEALGTFTAPGEFFSFDAAGIDPILGTRSFTGVYTSHAAGAGPLTYAFQEFTADEQALPVISSGDFTFNQSSIPVTRPTSMAWGPDGRLYVTELFGTIHAITLDANKQLVEDQVINTLTNSLGSRLTLGITVDPISTANDIILWVSHSSPSLNDGVPNSGMISRISGVNLGTISHEITGLPRAKANHGTNSIHFGPDDMLYIAQGGNTGAGAPSGTTGEFGDREEQPLSAAILVANVRDPGFDGSCHNPDDIYGPPPCDVTTFATGLRNAYDFVFHSNGQRYAADNGLGVAGTYPPSPTPPCLGFADPDLHSPGEQPDILVRLQQDKYYGHPDPHRDECVFKDGSLQGVPPLPNYEPPMLNLGKSKSANGIIEYTSDRFCGALQGDLLIANFSVGDNITRVHLSDDGLFVLDSDTLIGGFSDPLPLVQGPDGTIYVGEFGASQITALTPVDLGCWEAKQPLPQAILDSGGAALDGKLYSVAGKNSSTHISKTYIYDTATNTWTTGADLPGPAVENPAVVALNGKLYAFGGSTDPFSGAVNNAAIYDPAANTWTPLAPMPTARGGATAQAINGKIYVVGGMDADGNSVTTVEVYDPAGDSWSIVASMATPRDNAGSAVLDGLLYIFGGRNRGVNDTLSSVEAYDPASDTWSAKAPMPTGRRTMVVGTLNGRAQVMGGERTSSGGSFAANEEYDPLTNSWRTLNDMRTPRHGAAAGTIDGVVYVAGGGPTGGSAFSDILEAFSFQSP